VSTPDEDRWYAVRSVFRTRSSPEAPLPDAGAGESTYEERITLWQAPSSGAALEHAEEEAREYARFAGSEHLAGFGQVHQVADAPPRHGAEVFSLVRASDLPPQRYVERFLDTGRERQQ
jgi:hypothetical protein